MKKKLLTTLMALCLVCVGSTLKAQTLTFSANFIYGSSNNCPQWNTFQAAITPGIYTGIRMYGTYDPIGIVCNDPVIANAMAVAMKNASVYISPVTNGHVWHVCNRYQSEVWIDPPTSCSGSNCPNPGYLMRPCFGTTNYGGVNTATCSTIPTQTMSIDLIAPPPCAAPTNLNATNVTTTSAQVGWSPVSGSVGYEYLVDQSPSNPAGSGIPTANTSVPISGLGLNTTYYLHVRNFCSASLSSWWVTYAFTTPDAYCKPPVNILFSNITTISTDILWSLMPTADYYQYKVELTPTIPNVTGYTTTSSISAHASNLLPNTKYYVEVRSICLNGDDSSTWKLDSFVTKNYCEMPELHAPNPGNLNQDIWWNKVTNAISYEYRLSNFDLPPAFGTDIKDTIVSVTLPNDGSDQYLHVRTKCNSQFSFSDWNSIALRHNPNSIKNIQEAGNYIAIYPNPVKDRFTIIVNDNVSGTYVLTDVTGKSLLSGKVEKNAEVNLGAFANGTYIFKYTINGNAGILKLVKE